MIPFNKPYLTGRELEYIQEAVIKGKLSGNGYFTKKCQAFIDERYGFRKTLLTTSCTDALEMAAILAGIKEGDEVIIPSYTFVSTALAFVRQGAKVVFIDSSSDEPNMDVRQLESLITSRTRAIVPVHYAGVACDMDAVMLIAEKYNLVVIEDAAQAIDSYYVSLNKGRKALGGIGHMGCFSFHETKNVISGEGGLLAINDERFIKRSEIIWEKGTNRAEFFRGEVNKYGWVDVGSSFLPSELTAAFLYAQLESIDMIQKRRKDLWEKYYEKLLPFAGDAFQLPFIEDYATNNAHMFYLVCDSLDRRSEIIDYLKENGILSVFHYQSLHSSPYYIDKHDGRKLPQADRYSETLVRLPMYYELEFSEIELICDLIKKMI
ncbi:MULTISPECIES: dTDP-4-amino-4,6-dideoxygalactose transaminase [Bacteroides]|uniref:dTDP-4-amino-4,6-dideoxygalactose transaminase n=1 Tax=Bacteroides TaxID=816 RepID=UPI0018A06DA6|nr:MULTISPECIES: dTDP-4-amino-4,6-dideoxygalactose transaminase [Bacteroides]MDC2612099.1 dTDP-4-amino-4,6-dideoxygalactose transaminase [Bacteroides ovatus]MDC2632743.1 dTDP-4-amino-4,6-dideoxygalactose transaminase [Bacteroides ovatus]